MSEPFVINDVMKKREAVAEVKRLLEMVGLPADFADRYPHQLSGGQARRIGVARALALSPQLVLADEPTAGLDVSVQGELLNLLNELREKTGLAMLLITHNLHVIRHVADRMGILYLGRLVEEGRSADLFDAPRHPYTLCLLSANQSGGRLNDKRLILHGRRRGFISGQRGVSFTIVARLPKSRCAGRLRYGRTVAAGTVGVAPNLWVDAFRKNSHKYLGVEKSDDR